MATEFKLSYTGNEINAKLNKIDSLASKSELPTKTSDLTNDSNFATETYVENYAQPRGDYALKSEIPTALHNPNKLILTGAVNAEYDGSNEITVEIPIGETETETVLSDNLFDKSTATSGGVFYYSSSGLRVENTSWSYYAYVPLRGAGTYRTKWNNNQHSSTTSRVGITKEDNSWLQTINGTLTATDNAEAYDMEFVVTQAMINNGAAKIAFDCSPNILDTVMIVKDRDYPEEYIPYGYIEVSTDKGKKLDNVLLEKTAVFLGDSICAGTESIPSDSGFYNYGWGGIIGENNRMTWKNYGKNGGTVTSLASVQSTRWLTSQADSAIAEYPNADYVIFEGGCNDADQMKDAGLGVISSDYATFDTTTFSGAFEALVLKLVTAYPNAKIGYIIPQKMYAQNDHTASGHVHRRFFDRAVEICDKWGIPVIDLWRGSSLNPKLPNASTFYVDGQHLTVAGYQKLAPMIEAWMRDMYTQGVASSGNTGGVSSWNDLTDKPFGDMVEVFPETEFGLDTSLGAFVSPHYYPDGLVAGYDYVIRYNGVDYPCTAFDSAYNGMTCVAVGNTAASGGENNGLPFAVASIMDGFFALPLDGSTSVTIGIKAPRKLHAQYVPTPAQYVYECSISDFSKNQNGDLFDCAEPELPLALLEAVYHRKPIYMRMRDKYDSGQYNNTELLGPASVRGNYLAMAIALGSADKTSETFKIPEGTVIDGKEVTTQEMLFAMGLSINARFMYYLNVVSDFTVSFLDYTGLD